MNKLEIEHIAKHLPYGLKGNAENNEYYEPVICEELYRIETGNSIRSIVFPYIIVGETECEIEDFKPILRPLSDLAKEITHNGETFIPIEWLEEKYYICIHNSAKLIVEDNRWVNKVEYILIIHLLEWHFDVDQLIEQNLAIDLNTLETNPYK